MHNRPELRSLLGLQTRLPALPEGHPFSDVFNGWYWCATAAAINPAHAGYVALDGARMFCGGKDQSFMLWPVRGEGLSVVPRKGQWLCYDAAGKVISCTGSGQDGEFRYGAAWSEPRFEILHAGVLDIYWSSTISLFEPVWAWALHLEKGAPGVGQKWFAQFSVWAVATFDCHYHNANDTYAFNAAAKTRQWDREESVRTLA